MLTENSNISTPLAVYIHWPFCKAKCPYCDFNSHVRESVDQAAWRGALLTEMAHMASLTKGRRVESIFFGGGTPSLMPPETAAALIDAAAKHWAMADDAEITLEANPTSVEASSFAGFRDAGVNRVSLGVQSLDTQALKFLGRQHSADEALKAVALAARIFPRYSFDLIYARPGQSVKAWEAELREALAYADGHLSLYQLTIEENTMFHVEHRKGALILPEDSVGAELYEHTQEIMEAAGMPAYEISNHARPGQESRHNLAYWQGHEYVGIGPGAHGRVLGIRDQESGIKKTSLDTRYPIPDTRFATQTIKSPERWLEAVGRSGHGMEIFEPISEREAAEEKLMMRLRLTAGFPRAEMPFLCAETIAKLEAHGLLEKNPSHIQPTLKGRLLLNTLTAELVG